MKELKNAASKCSPNEHSSFQMRFMTKFQFGHIFTLYFTKGGQKKVTPHFQRSTIDSEKVFWHPTGPLRENPTGYDELIQLGMMNSVHFGQFCLTLLYSALCTMHTMTMMMIHCPRCLLLDAEPGFYAQAASPALSIYLLMK